MKIVNIGDNTSIPLKYLVSFVAFLITTSVTIYGSMGASRADAALLTNTSVAANEALRRIEVVEKARIAAQTTNDLRWQINDSNWQDSKLSVGRLEGKIEALILLTTHKK